MLNLFKTIPIVACLGVVGCASYTAEYQQRLLGTLPSQRGVEFEDQRRYPGDVLCGSFTQRNFITHQKITGPFVVTPALVLTRPSDAEVAIYCSEDAEAALLSEYGIGGPEADWSLIAEAAREMKGIEAAVAAYHGVRYRSPQQLAQLLEGDYGVSDAAALEDPWGRSYLFDPGMAGRSLPQIKVRTLGQDGEPGGTGVDADLSLDQADLLIHVLGLRD